jgi:hypothetical protein
LLSQEYDPTTKSSCSRKRACWRTLLAQKQELVEEFCLHKNKSLLKPTPTKNTLHIQKKECPQRIFINKPWTLYYSLLHLWKNIWGMYTSFQTF